MRSTSDRREPGRSDDGSPPAGSTQQIWRAGTDRMVSEDHPEENPGSEVYGPESGSTERVDDGGPEQVTRGRSAGDPAGLYTDEDQTPR